MTRFFATLVAIGLIGLCTAARAQSEPLTIQPTQEIQFAQAGSGGIALHGAYLFAGIPGGDVFPAVAGLVNIYRKESNSQCSESPCWVAAGQLQRPEAFAGDQFGASLDFDGRTLIVGSPAFLSPDSSNTDDAAVFAFERDGSRFAFQQKLLGVPVPANPGGFSHFGETAVLAGDRLAITQLPEFVPGSAYVFKRNERGVWHREAQLQPAAITIHDQFGVSVDINSDTLICGSDTTGYATVFYRHGDDWKEGPTLTAPDQALNGGGGFGRSVALHGNKAAVGAYFSTDPNFSIYLGSEYVFEREGRNWSQKQQLINPVFDPNTSPSFGAESLFRNDRIAVASAFAIYIYERQDRQWTLAAKLVSSSLFSITNSLDSMDWDASTLVAVTTTGIAIFDLSSLDARPAALAPR